MQERKSKQELFEVEMLPFCAALHNYAMILTHDADEANDLVQETYMRAYIYSDRYTHGTNARAWLFRIMKNLCINHLREGSHKSKHIRFDDIERSYTGPEESYLSTKNFQDELLDKLLDDDVEKALRRIPDDFKTVLILSDIEEYDYKEIADFIGIPIGTVRSRLHRGRRIMRSLLSEYASNHGYTNVGVGGPASQ